MSQQPMQVVFEEGLMLLLDEEDQGYDCMDVCETSIEEATAQIDDWARQYAFDAKAAKRELEAYVSEL